MPDPPAFPIELQLTHVRRDVACPNCDYNLRGLQGLMVRCPECGMIWDVIDLAAMRRRMREDPATLLDYRLLRLPGLWLLICCGFALGALMTDPSLPRSERLGELATLWFGVLVGGWAIIGWWVWRVFDSPVSLLLAAGSLGLAIGKFVCGAALILCGIWLLGIMVDHTRTGSPIAGDLLPLLVIAPPAAAVLWLLQFPQRRLLKRAQLNYLRRQELRAAVHLESPLRTAPA